MFVQRNTVIAYGLYDENITGRLNGNINKTNFLSNFDYTQTTASVNADMINILLIALVSLI